MDRQDSDHLHYNTGDGSDPDGVPWKPTRASPGTILMVLGVCGFFCFLFLMFILRVF